MEAYTLGFATMITETIVAQCTPTGPGAIALLRVSGPQALSIVTQCAKLSSKQLIDAASSHTIHHGWITDKNNDNLDEVMFLVMQGPKTFTGHNVVEITCHNNSFIIESIINRIIECGARPAQRGEFTRQAVESGKLDLIRAEAINELIHANSQHQLKLSLEQLSGSFSAWVLKLETALLKLIALCEASFEFIEEEIDFSEQMKSALAQIKSDIERIKKSFDQQQQLRQGIRIALIGSVNAGKSSLFNVLIGKERAIVTNIAGTTRDVIEAGLYKSGTYWTLIDTAGLRQTENIIEQEGIERSLKEAKTADVVLLVVDGSRTLTEQEEIAYKTILNNYGDKIILVQNKSDQSEETKSLFVGALLTSAQTGKGIKELEVLLEKRILKRFTQNSSPFLLNKRHFTTLVSFEQKLEVVKAMLQGQIEYELVAHHLKDALEVLTELTGKTVSEKAMDTVFKEFCVGK